MAQDYRIGVQLLETGIDLVSPHLRWLIRNMILDYLGTDKLDLLCYRIQTPDDKFGEAHSPCRAITINLIKHFDEIAPKLEEGDNKYSSLKCMLLKEILNTAAHESHHILASHNSENWDNSDLEEEKCKEVGEDLSWHVAKKYDVEIEHFGPLLDDSIEEFIEGLRGIIAQHDEEKTEVPEWMALQVYMYENKLAYYHPESDTSLSFRKAFETGAEDEDPWIDECKKFIAETPQTVDSETVAPVAGANETQPAPAVAPTAPTTTPAAATPPSNPVTEQAPQTTVQQPVGIGQLNGGLQDAPMLDDSVMDGMGKVPAPVAPATPAANPAPAAAAANPTPTAAAGGTGQPLQVVESVLRRLFHHVNSKCEFNTDGGYNNPYAVLEGVSIADIPGAQELFAAMDTTDETGKFLSQQQCNGMIKGLVSKGGLPRYTLYLNMGGQLHKRTFIAQNPNKLDSSGQNLTKWAQAVRSGKRIMMLLQDNIGPRADIQLDAGQPLGMEKFNVWEQNANR
jgi:hypothetical protein